MESSKKNVMVLVLMVFVMFMHGAKWAEAQVHHVVGDDRGWDLASDIASWAEGRTFIVGDFLWFAYAGGLDKDNIVELRTKEQFETCDLSNPIKMYTDGIEKISLEQKGIRYFTSSNLDNCKNGLKLPVDIKSKSTAQNQPLRSTTTSQKGYQAQEPSAPSSSTKIRGSIMVLVVATIFAHVTL